jgi:hypothetical protein
VARLDGARGTPKGRAVSLSAAEGLWGPDAVRAALAEPGPDPATPELIDEARAYVDNPGALRSWALAQPWPRFCAIVRVISGTILSETFENE